MSEHDEHRDRPGPPDGPTDPPGSAPPPASGDPSEPMLRCSRCERAIPVSQAIEAPVGYQCRDCAKGAVPARRLQDLRVRPVVTYGLLAVIGVVFLLTMIDEEGTLIDTFALRPVLMGDGEWWLLLTSAFLHANLMHIAFNGILLWRLGEMLETHLGPGRFAALYAAGIAGGGFGVTFTGWLYTTPVASIPVLGDVLATHPGIPTVGASGAVFALMGAAMAGMRDSGVNPWRTDIGGLVLLNLVITFVFSERISVGGHIGGLLAGLAVGRLLFVERTKVRRAIVLVLAIALALAVAAYVLSDLTLTRMLQAL